MPTYWLYSKWHAWWWLQRVRHRPRRCRSHRVSICRKRAARVKRLSAIDWRRPVRVADINVSELVADPSQVALMERLLNYQSKVE